MAVLTAATRGALPGKSFALPGRRYPIPDYSHAINARARVQQFGTTDEREKVYRATAHKFPQLAHKALVHQMRG